MRGSSHRHGDRPTLEPQPLLHPPVFELALYQPPKLGRQQVFEGDGSYQPGVALAGEEEVHIELFPAWQEPQRHHSVLWQKDIRAPSFGLASCYTQ